MSPAGKYIEANGLRVYYETYGEGKPLLLIHGGTATAQSWTSHLLGFAAHFRVFAPTVAVMAGPTTQWANSATA